MYCYFLRDFKFQNALWRTIFKQCNWKLFSLCSSAGCFTIAEEGKAFGRATRVYLNLNYDMLLVVKKRNKVEISCTQTGKFQQSRSPKELSDSISHKISRKQMQSKIFFGFTKLNEKTIIILNLFVGGWFLWTKTESLRHQLISMYLKFITESKWNACIFNNSNALWQRQITLYMSQ